MSLAQEVPLSRSHPITTLQGSLLPLNSNGTHLAASLLFPGKVLRDGDCHMPLRRPKQFQLEQLENQPLSKEGSGFQLKLRTGVITAEVLSKTTECGAAMSRVKSLSLEEHTGWTSPVKGNGGDLCIR